ncbi:MAG: BON domain-containing protein [Aridibacter famidurans]|nr:BON domain-containing protein [Aridibacter famidurans]
MNNRILKTIAGLAAMALVLAMAVPSFAQDEDREEGLEEIREADKVFSEIMSKPDKAIPRELLENATAIGIFPDVVKAAFIVGGSGGDGIVVRRDANGNWATPAFYDISGASFGAQIGAKSTDYIMLFMNEDALMELEDDKLEFGGNVSFAAGPVGRTAGASTNATLDSGILTWSRSEGAFVGASLKGAVLTADNDINRAFYNARGGDVLKSKKMMATGSAASEIADLRNTLKMYGGTSTTNSMNRDANSPNTEVAFRNSNMNRYVRYEPFDNTMRPVSENVDMASIQVLARRVRNELLTLPYYSVFDWIEFEIDPNGVVTLMGKVTTPPDTKSRAAAYVEDVEGVTGVVNRIEVLPLSSSDDRLRRALYREIYSGTLFRYQVGSLQNIHIIVDNGRVTLQGVVDNAADKNVAGVRANSVPGIFSVTNNLAVRPDTEPR